MTLYHWDLPQALEDARRVAVARHGACGSPTTRAWWPTALGEFQPHWITLNEPYCSAIVGYAQGRHAPGAKEGHGALAAAHHLLLAHGLACPCCVRTAAQVSG